MKTEVSCDMCGKIMSAAEAHYDAGSERDLCEKHFLQEQLKNAICQRDNLSESQKIAIRNKGQNLWLAN